MNLHYLVVQNIVIAKETARLKDIAINSEVSEDIVIMADVQMMNTILRNLISNAIKFTPKGGEIFINALEQNEWHVISVRDTGIGMDETLLSNLFKIDMKVSRKGTDGESSTGLGLLLCKEFVEKHSGFIRVDSEVGKGSTFYVYIPNVIEEET